MKSWLLAVDRGLARLETLLLVWVLAATLGLSLLSMVLRWLGTGLSFTDPLIRHGVLWLGLLGASAAARVDGHVQLSALSWLLSPGQRLLLTRLTAAAAAPVCAIFTRSSIAFVSAEREAASLAFGGLPLWPLQIILPLGFALLTLRMVLLSLLGPQGTVPKSLPTAPEAP